MGTGILYIVATPIGNLEDMTFRAIRVLQEVDLIAAEDTRHSLKLLNHFGISRPLTSYFDHNNKIKGPFIISRLLDGKSVALMTDAGTPCISDPGYLLVREALAEGIQVVPVPGPSAAIAALSASGLPADSFTFVGFLPNRQGKRRSKLAELISEQRLLILYESPNRLLVTLHDIREILGNREVVIARELTKVYEEFIHGSVSEIVANMATTQVRGEVVILIAPGESTLDDPGENVDDLLRDLLVREGVTVKDAVNMLTGKSGLPRREIYSKALTIRNKEK